MHREAVTSLLESDERLARSVSERDEEVNRLYFLLVRLLRTVIQHPRLSEQLKISPIDCLDLRLVASLVEGIGDYAAEIAWYVYKFPKATLPASLLKQIAKLSELAYEIHEKAIKSVFARDFQLAMNITSMQIETKTILTEIEDALTKLPPSLLTHASAIISCLKRIYEYGMDIADLVMPE
jgi:phosphate uptake regulator